MKLRKREDSFLVQKVKGCFKAEIRHMLEHNNKRVSWIAELGYSL